MSMGQVLGIGGAPGIGHSGSAAGQVLPTFSHLPQTPTSPAPNTYTPVPKPTSPTPNTYTPVPKPTSPASNANTSGPDTNSANSTSRIARVASVYKPRLNMRMHSFGVFYVRILTKKTETGVFDEICTKKHGRRRFPRYKRHSYKCWEGGCTRHCPVRLCIGYWWDRSLVLARQVQGAGGTGARDRWDRYWVLVGQVRLMGGDLHQESVTQALRWGRSGISMGQVLWIGEAGAGYRWGRSWGLVEGACDPGNSHRPGGGDVRLFRGRFFRGI